MQRMRIAFVELDDGTFEDSADVTGRQLSLAVKRAKRQSDVQYYLDLVKLHREFRRAGGTDTETVGQRILGRAQPHTR